MLPGMFSRRRLAGRLLTMARFLGSLRRRNMTPWDQRTASETQRGLLGSDLSDMSPALPLPAPLLRVVGLPLRLRRVRTEAGLVTWEVISVSDCWGLG